MKLFNVTIPYICIMQFYSFNKYLLRGYKRKQDILLLLPELSAWCEMLHTEEKAENCNTVQKSKKRLVGKNTGEYPTQTSQGAPCELPKTFLAAGVIVNSTDEQTKN